MPGGTTLLEIDVSLPLVGSTLRELAQLRRALGLGPRCCRFKSGVPDQTPEQQRFRSTMLSPFLILVILALLLSIACLIWPKPFLGPIALVLICVALLIGAR